MRQNELRDSTANLLSDVCHNFEIEHHLQRLQGETFTLKSSTTDDDDVDDDDDDARLDINAGGLWELRIKET